MPVLFFVLLMVGYRDSFAQATPLSRAIRFLHAEYRPELFYVRPPVWIPWALAVSFVPAPLIRRSMGESLVRSGRCGS